MLHLGIVKTYDSETHKAGIQLAGSLTTYLDDIAVATNIAPEAMTVGNYVLVAIPGGNPRDACIVASWPAGSSGGGGGTKIQDADGDTYLWVEKTADEDKIHGVVKGVEAFLLDDAGILNLPKQSSAGIDSNAGQSIPDNTWTYLTYNIEQYDVQNEVDLANNWIKVKTAGTYLVAQSNIIYSFPSPYLLAAQIHGSVHGELAYGNVMSSATDNLRVTAFGICSLSANEEVRGRLYQHTGSAQSLSTYTGQNWLRVYKLG